MSRLIELVRTPFALIGEIVDTLFPADTTEYHAMMGTLFDGK